ncbi:substrate-binding periplasmic protein [Salmonirosea aquatica]|uniref:Transporter substrate-binding domain-containing protein n=1 Tax=Salmonirosea aquatica TaxID=2654236 RepID=A0A7C9BF30_9BACT|nr:transporter substrate-binding domain-containing protein [Cytophagaceae bacterium SJW1-29]
MNEKLKIGLDFAAPVPLHTDFSKGNFEGFEVDLMNQIAAELNLELEYSVSFWKDIIRDLQDKKIDVICSAATKTSEREKEFLFSRPYLDFHLGVVCYQSNRLSLDDLTGKRIGVRISTEAEKYLKEKFSDIKLEYSDSNEELYSQLRKKEIDALLDDSPIAFGLTQDNPELSISSLLPDTSAQYAIMLNKNNLDLKKKLDVCMDKFSSNGLLEELQQKWFKGAEL